jgi:hypothetical protein
MSKSLTDYREDLREHIRDLALHNRLLRFTEEFTDAELERALNKALAGFNGLPPRAQTYSFTSFPDDSLIIDMATCQVLKMSGFQKTRNALNYSEGGTTIADTEKVGYYMQWVNMICTQARAEAKELKMALNIEGMLDTCDGISTEYSLL